MYKRLILVELILIEARKPSLLSVSPTSHIRVSCTRIFNIINCSQPPQLPPPTISNHLEISLDEEERRDTYFRKSKPRGDTLTVAREATR